MIRMLLFSLLPLSLFAAAPAKQATGFTKTDVQAWKFTFSYAAAAGDAQGYLVQINTSNNFINPTNGVVYKSGAPLGSAKVLSNNALLSQTVKGCWANTKYYIKIFAFNTPTNPEYNLINPLLDSVVTTGKNVGNYYNGLNPGSTDFLSKLSALINNHTMRTYDDYEKILVPEFYERDTVVNDTSKKVVECEYSNEIKIYNPPFDFANSSLNYSREHVLCKNWMNKRGIPNGDLIYYPEGCDYHNLLLTRTSNVNSSRSDNPYGKVNNVISSYLDCKFGKDASGVYVFEPANESKGNGARCMFYEMVCYNGFNGGWGLLSLNAKAPQQDQSLLKSWHKTDSIDNFEIARHEFIYSLQKNRNPFIDFPEWTDCIDFSNISSLKCASSYHQNQLVPYDFVIYEQDGRMHVDFQYDQSETLTIQLFDLSGKQVWSQSIEVVSGYNRIQLPWQPLSSSLYCVKISGSSFFNATPIKFVH